MTTETASLLCPAALSETHHEGLSGRYIHLNTSDIVGRFMEADPGLVVAGSWGRKARKGAVEHAAHTVSIRNPSKAIIDPRNPSKPLTPEVIIENSHNGTGSLRFVLGLFAQVCTNGLCIAYGESAVYSHPHLNRRDESFSTADAAAVLSNLFGKLDDSAITIQRMAATQLSLADRHTLARDMIEMRWPDRTGGISTETIESALSANRAEDAKDPNSLWTTFNILQERICGGSVRFNRKSRKITNQLLHNRLNLALWNKAELLLN